MLLRVIWRTLPLLLMTLLAGCATSGRAPEQAPPTEVTADIWKQVDSAIAAEALAAIEPATGFARHQMEGWRQSVARRSEADFIPWFSGYLTQQWLTVKLAWYQLNADNGNNPPTARLAAYLQEQYHERVLAPAAKDVDPAALVAQATALYVRQLGSRLDPIARRYGIPQPQFQQRLKAIPAIALGPPATHDASLYQLVYTEPIDSLPAYAVLLRRVREAGGNAGAGLAKTRISPMARQVSEKLLNQLAISGSTSAASTLLGGVAGTVISLGAAGFGLMLHEARRGDIEKQLRETLNAAMDDMWQILVEDTNTGVMAGIYYLADEIDQSFPKTFTQPAALEQLPQEIPLPELSPNREAIIDEALPDDAEGE